MYIHIYYECFFLLLGITVIESMGKVSFYNSEGLIWVSIMYILINQ